MTTATTTENNISKALAARIYTYGTELRENSELLAAAKSNRLSKEQLGDYLASVEVLLRHTPKHLALAQKLSKEMNQPELHQFFTHKQEEEEGHHQWVQEDLSRSGNSNVARINKPMAVQRAEELMDYVELLIRKDTSLYLSYILLAELVTVLVGNEWASAATSSAGVDKNSMSSITKHVELDRYHVEEGIAEIEALVSADKKPQMLEALDGAIVRFDAVLEAIASQPSEKAA